MAQGNARQDGNVQRHLCFKVGMCVLWGEERLPLSVMWSVFLGRKWVMKYIAKCIRSVNPTYMDHFAYIHVIVTHIRCKVFPAPQKVPSCPLPVNNSSQIWPLSWSLMIRLVLPVLEFHIKGIMWYLPSMYGLFAQHIASGIHPCFFTCWFFFLLLYCIPFLCSIPHLYLSVLILMDIWVVSNLVLFWIGLYCYFCMWYLVDICIYFTWLFT